ncbi:MAG TPA: DUF4838 domain-containing protein [Verrucomicrobiae bacterium]|nr:DUF4838 domain-containing protein [Verrucomicrobiae bacterium]
MLGILLAAAAFPIVENGQPRAVLPAPPPDAPVEVRRSVTEFRRVIEKMTDAALPTDGPAGSPVIHVGRDSFVEGVALGLDQLDEDGFVIRTPSPGHLILAGRTPHGTEFAVYRFLHKYAGARWYFPTELGEVVPRQQSFAVGDLSDREEPSFRSRLWSSAAPFDGGAWERHNLCRGRYNFHHNLLKIFVPSTLYDKHPDWFPEIDGNRFRPADDHAHNWQPCFANPDVAHYAAAAARKHFDANPDAASFSLGMNDTAAHGFCECAACRSLDPTDPTLRKTPRDLPNYSNRFFTFVNRVAADVQKTHPGKFLGCLAYHVTEPPPEFDVQPCVIPYLTAGRANWTDPAIREGDQRLIAAWTKKVPIVGIYDYYYGAGFVSPRLFTRLTEESLKYASAAGANAFYAEIYSTWSLDGPKAWVASQMLWNVNQSAEALVDDFCRGLFGAAAAPMRDYFLFVEGCWMARPPGSTVMWAGFFDAKQLDLWPPGVCAKARSLLDAATESAAQLDEVVRRRVRLYSDGFRQTELWSALYHGEKSLESVSDVRRCLKAQADLADIQRAVIKPNPLHRAPIAFESRARNLPGRSLVGALLRLADKPGADAALRELAANDQDPESSAAARAALTLQEHPDKAPEVLANPGFEASGTDGAPKKTARPVGWNSWFRPNTPGELQWSAEAAHGGALGVTLRGAIASSVLQSIPVKPGEQYVASVLVRIPRPWHAPQGEAQLLLQWQDASGKWLTGAAKPSSALPGTDVAGWTRLAAFATVPPAAGRLVLCICANGQAPEDELHIDDASLRRLTIARTSGSPPADALAPHHRSPAATPPR